VKTLLIAHRGATEVVPENTLSAFGLAIHKGFRAVECDVQLTSDGHLVVIHDETLSRTTDGSGWVSRRSYHQIKGLAMAGGEHIPGLEEVVGLVVGHAKRKLIIEIKGDSEQHALKVAIALAKYLKHLHGAHLRRIEVHSFWYGALRIFKRQCPLVTTAAIINGGFAPSEIIAIARKCRVDGVSLNYEFISKSAVRACHKAGLFVDTWAVPDKTVMKRLRRFGLEAIVENYSGRAKVLA